MGKVKWILVCGFLMAALSVNVAAEGPKSDMGVFFDSHGTTGWSATMATLVMAVGSEIAPADGHISQDLDTAISVSNTCVTPLDVLGLEGGGFPECGVGPDGMSGDVGPVWLFCQGQDPDTRTLTYNSAGDPAVVIGTGLNEDGELEAGGTWTFFLSDVLRAVGVPTGDQNFIGHCYVVGQGIDAIVGSYVNFNTLTDPPLVQDFSMQADMEGNDVEIVIP